MTDGLYLVGLEFWIPTEILRLRTPEDLQVFWACGLSAIRERMQLSCGVIDRLTTHVTMSWIIRPTSRSLLGAFWHPGAPEMWLGKVIQQVAHTCRGSGWRTPLYVCIHDPSGVGYTEVAQALSLCRLADDCFDDVALLKMTSWRELPSPRPLPRMIALKQS